MKAEQTFIKQLEAFLDTEFNDFSKKRIISFLDDYKQNIPPIIIDKTVVKTYAEVHPVYKTFVTEEEMIKLAKEMCDLYGIKIQDFLNRRTARVTKPVAELRRKFCQKLYENYLCNNSVLSKFFNVNHSTISFYLYGNKHKANTSSKVKTVKDEQY